MSGRLVSRVIEVSAAVGMARLLEVVIASHAKDDGTGARLSSGTLAREAKVSERYVRDLLGDLVAMGELTIIRKAGSTNRFRVHPGGEEPESRPLRNGSAVASKPSLNRQGTVINGTAAPRWAARCPRCKEGYLKLKAGRNGKFVGCTRWGAGCQYTEPPPPELKRGDTPQTVYARAFGGWRDGDQERLAQLARSAPGVELMDAIRFDPTPRDGQLLDRLEAWADHIAKERAS